MSKYGTHVKPMLPLIFKWIQAGLSEKVVSMKLGVAYSTFRTYKEQHRELSELIIEAHKLPDATVQMALFDMAKGGTYIEEQPIKVKKSWYDERGKKVEEENVIIVEIEKYRPPNMTAIIFYLTNRMPEQYKHNPNKELLDAKKLEHQKDMDSKRYW